MLPGEFYYTLDWDAERDITEDFIENTPKMQEISISDHESGKEPTEQMHGKVMINVVPEILDSKITLFIICVHSLCDGLSQFRIQI